MVEVFVLDQDAETRVRLAAARVAQLRRSITRSNALRDLDAQIVREAVAAGHRRGAAFTLADTFADALAARLTEIDRLEGGHPGGSNVVALRRAGGAA